MFQSYRLTGASRLTKALEEVDASLRQLKAASQKSMNPLGIKRVGGSSKWQVVVVLLESPLAVDGQTAWHAPDMSFGPSGVSQAVC